MATESDEFKDIPVLDVDYHLREYDDVAVRLGNVGGLDPVAELCSEARREIIRLRSGPGGIMEMKQTIADKEDEIKRLRFLMWEADCMISEGDADHAQSLIREELMEKK